MIYLGIAVAVFLLDFFVKRYIDKKKELNRPELICKNRLILRKYYNDGAALNLLKKYPKVMRGIHGVLMGIFAVIYGLTLRKKDGKMLKTGLSFLMGGGSSNLFDRITKGHVVDYFSFPVKNKWLRGIIFNISDFFVFLGAVLSVLAGK